MGTKVKKLDGTNVLTDDKQAQKQKDEKLSKAITLAVEMESSFKLFSYRIIDPQVFISRVDELLNFYKS